MATTPLIAPDTVDISPETIEHPHGTLLTRRLLVAMSTAVALHMSPGLAQTDSTRILQREELPKVMNVKRGDTHTDMKPGMDGKKTWTVTSTVETSSPSVSLEGTKGYGQMVQLPNGGGEKSFAEISMLSKEEKEKVINGMTDDDFKKYEKWEEEKENLMAMKKSEGKKAELIEIDKANEGKKAELIRTYYAYVTNIEAGAGGERAVLNKILEKDFTPQDLKQRVENLLRRKDMKLALR